MRERPLQAGLVRILIGLAFTVPFCLPAIFINLKDVGSPYIIMFTNIALPFSVMAFLLASGLYDYSV